MVPDDKPKVKNMKTYNLIISILAVIGIALVFENYKSLSPEKGTSDKGIGDVLD